MKQNRLLGLTIPALLCTLLWGSAFPAVKSGYALFGIADASGKLYFAGWRFMLAGVAVLVLSVIANKRLIIPKKTQWRAILLLGIVQTTMQYIFFYIGLSHTTGVKGSVISATATFFAVGISHFLFADDRLNASRALGCALGFVGVLCVTLGSLDGLGGGLTLTGEGFMLIAAAASGGGAVISKFAVRGQSPMVVTGWQLTFGGAVLLLAGTAGGGQFNAASPSAFCLLGYLIFLSAAAFTLWTWLLGRYPVGRVSIYNFLVPVFGSLLSGLVLNETVFTARTILSLLLVCAGIVLVNRQKQTVGAAASSGR